MTDVIELILAIGVLGIFAVLSGGIILWMSFYLTRR